MNKRLALHELLCVEEGLCHMNPNWLDFLAISAVRCVKFDEPHPCEERKFVCENSENSLTFIDSPSERTSRNRSLSSRTLEPSVSAPKELTVDVNY